MSLLLLLMRFVLGAVFVYSGFSKLMVPVENFAAVIEGYRFLNHLILIRWAALILPWFELIFGTFLLTGFLSRVSASVLGLLSAIFISLLARSLILKLPIAECGCFGSGISLAPQQALLLDLVLFLMAVCLSIFPAKRLSLDQRLGR